jgi:osmoprotectant transport system permease protein
MIVLGIPPILVNAYTGVSEVDRDLTEAASGIGLTARQVLGTIELPLSAGIIVAGMGSAAVQIIATATLGAIFGFGGLGTYLVQGIAQNDDGMLFSGVVLVALLAVGAQAAFALLARVLTPRGLRAGEGDAQRPDATPEAAGSVAG